MSKAEFRRAEAEIPHAFFESPELIEGVEAVVLLAITIGQIIDNKLIPTIPLSMASATTYIIGRIMDRQSTLKSLKIQERAEKLKIEHPIIESNPLLPNKMTAEEYVSSPKKFLDYSFSIIAPIFPSIGIAAGIGGGLAALNNYRGAKRLERAIEIKAQSSNVPFDSFD